MQTSPRAEGSLTGGYIWTFGATALPLVSAFMTSLIIARWMGPRIAGLINWTMALTTVFLVLAKFGVDGAASRLVSEYQVAAPANVPRLIRLSLLLRLLFTLPVAALATIFAPQLTRFFGEPDLLPLVRLSGLLVLAVSLNELTALLVLGLRRFRLLFMMRILMLLLRVGLVLAAAFAALEARGVIGAFILAALAPALGVLALLMQRGTPAGAPAGSGQIWRKLVKLAVPLAVSGASVTVYSLLDKLMLGKFEGASPVGLYSIARNVLETTLFPTFALIMVLRPALAGAYALGQRQRCSVIVNRSIRSSMYYAACVVVVLACLSRPLVTGLFTERFAYSADLLVLFLPLVVMRSLGAVILPGLIAAERAGTYARLTLVGAVLNFVLNLILIPHWHAKGAVISTLLSYLPIEVLGLKTLAGVMPGYWRRGDTVTGLKIGATGTVLTILYLNFMPQPVTLPVAIAHAVAIAGVFTGALLAVRAIALEEVTDLVRPCLRIFGGR